MNLPTFSQENGAASKQRKRNASHKTKRLGRKGKRPTVRLAGGERLEERALLAGVPFLNVEAGVGTSADLVYDMTRDAGGNTIVVGKFDNAITLGQGEPNETTLSGVSTEGFVAKYAPDGALLWAHAQGSLTTGSGDNDRTRGVAVDAAGNIYVTGEMRGDLDVDGDGNADIAYQEGYETFVVKYSAGGAVLDTLNLPGDDLSRRVEVTDTGIFVVGFFSSGDFDPNPSETFALDATVTGRALFLAKYDLSGNFVTARQFGSLREDGTFFGNYDTIWTTDVDVDGAIYIAGRLDATQEAGADFDGDGVADTPLNSRSDAFLVKYDANGNFQWLQDVESESYSVGIGVAVHDSASNSEDWSVYWSGGYAQSAVVAGATLTSPTGDGDAFVAKLNASSGAMDVVTSIGGEGTDYVTYISVSAEGRIFAGGVFLETIEVGAQTLSTSSTRWDGFLTELDANLYPLEAHQISSDQTVGSQPMVLEYDDDSGLLYVASDFAGETTFPTGETISSSNDSPDIFVAAFDFSLGSISGRIFADLDGDTLDNDGVSLPDGFVVELYQDSNGDGLLDPSDSLLDSNTAATGSGAYTFSNLAAGNYLVAQVLPAGWTATSDPDSLATVTLGVNVDGSVGNAAANFGNYHPSKVTVYQAPNHATGARIKDNSFNSAFFSINDSFTILDLDVTVDVSHTSLADLTVDIEGPADASGASTRIKLYDQSSAGADLTNTVFDDDAATPVSAGEAPFTGRYQPVGGLRAFDQSSVQGQWTLHVNDFVRNREQGTLNGWSLSVTHLTEPSAPADEHDVAVTSVSAPNSAETNADFTLQAEVVNEGLNAETFTVTVVNSKTQETVQQWSVSLEAGDSQTLSTVISTDGLAEGDYVFDVTADVVAGETDTTDNSASTTVTITAGGGNGGGKGGGKPQKLVGESVGTTLRSDEQLSQRDAEAMASVVMQLWGDMGHSADLPVVQIVVADLPDNLLGATIGNVVTLDADAAGIGWFVDSTPWENSEFEAPNAGSAAAERYDLLSVIAHEVGHVLGLDHDDELMSEVLSVGERHLPTDEFHSVAPPLDSPLSDNENEDEVLANSLALEPVVADTIWSDSDTQSGNSVLKVTSPVSLDQDEADQWFGDLDESDDDLWNSMF